MRQVAQAYLPARPPPVRKPSLMARVRRDFFGSTATSLVTAVLSIACLWFAWSFAQWAIIDAVFSVGAEGPQACRAEGVGACWAIIPEKARLILFGIYPYEEQWRPAIAMSILLLLYVFSTRRTLWNWRLAGIWLAGLAVFGLLMWGGALGLRPVGDDQWGGLAVTLILATLGLAAGFPLAILLALLRHNSQPSVGKALAVAYIEVVRSIPLLAVLFFASVMVPLFMPPETDLSKLFRVFVAFTLFVAAYLAEVIRGGLQAIPKGQYEASAALGLSTALTTLKIVLPQALTTVLPAIMNVLIAFFKATSIVVVVGIFDLMTAAKRAVADPLWQGFGTEVYLFVATLYFAFCYAMSRYSEHLHSHLRAGRKS